MFIIPTQSYTNYTQLIPIYDYSLLVPTSSFFYRNYGWGRK